MPQAAALSHRLNAPCNECQHAKWLHTDHCISKGCDCTHTATEFRS